jgi:hypothetical protein
MLGVLADVSEDLVGLSDLTESKSGETDLDKGTVVHNLVLDGLHSDYLRHMSFHHHVSGFSEPVMEGEVIDLLEGHSDTLLGQTPFLDNFNQISHSLLRVLQEVDSFRSLAETLLDGSVGAVILVVDVVKFDNCKAGLVFLLVEVTEIGQ